MNIQTFLQCSRKFSIVSQLEYLKQGMHSLILMHLNACHSVLFLVGIGLIWTFAEQMRWTIIKAIKDWKRLLRGCIVIQAWNAVDAFQWEAWKCAALLSLFYLLLINLCHVHKRLKAATRTHSSLLTWVSHAQCLNAAVVRKDILADILIMSALKSSSFRLESAKEENSTDDKKFHSHSALGNLSRDSVSLSHRLDGLKLESSTPHRYTPVRDREWVSFWDKVRKLLIAVESCSRFTLRKLNVMLLW